MSLLFARFWVLLPALLLCGGWVGVNPKPLRKQTSSLKQGQSGTYYQLGDDERKELVWMAKAAKAAYSTGEKPLGYRSFSRAEWDMCAVGCTEILYADDGSFTVGSGLRGRLMVNMLNEGRVVLALCGVEDLDLKGKLSVSDTMKSKDLAACIGHYFARATVQQYEQALRLMKGVLAAKSRSHLWIVGHSLGGSLTTYLALEIPESRTRVKCATFNGYGHSPNIEISEEKIAYAQKRLRNIYTDGDPVYNWKLSKFAEDVPFVSIVDKLPPPRHFGPSYSIIGKGGAMEQHDLDSLLKLMIEHRTGWAGL